MCLLLIHIAVLFSFLGVPWRIDEPEGLHTFRMGLFGLDKMGNIAGTVTVMENALDTVLEESGHVVPDTSNVAWGA